MRTVLRLSFAWVSLVVCACAGSLPRPPYTPQPSSALSVVPIPPPPARVEEVPRAPVSGAVWIDGEWLYRRGRWAWVLGRWVTAPPGAFFSPWAVVRAPDGAIYFAPGAWRDKNGKAVAAPPSLAVASASAGAVVDAEGVIQSTGRTLKPEMASEGSLEAPQEPADAGAPAP
jgi:hypothetical protein